MRPGRSGICRSDVCRLASVSTTNHKHCVLSGIGKGFCLLNFFPEAVDVDDIGLSDMFVHDRRKIRMARKTAGRLNRLYGYVFIRESGLDVLGIKCLPCCQNANVKTGAGLRACQANDGGCGTATSWIDAGADVANAHCSFQPVPARLGALPLAR